MSQSLNIFNLYQTYWSDAIRWKNDVLSDRFPTADRCRTSLISEWINNLNFSCIFHIRIIAHVGLRGPDRVPDNTKSDQKTLLTEYRYREKLLLRNLTGFGFTSQITGIISMVDNMVPFLCSPPDHEGKISPFLSRIEERECMSDGRAVFSLCVG